MAWQKPCNSEVWFNHLAPNWWIGWHQEVGFQLFNQADPPVYPLLQADLGYQVSRANPSRDDLCNH